MSPSLILIMHIPLMFTRSIYYYESFLLLPGNAPETRQCYSSVTSVLTVYKDNTDASLQTNFVIQSLYLGLQENHRASLGGNPMWNLRFSSHWGYTCPVNQPQLVLPGTAVSIFWWQEATSGAWTPPPSVREGEICKLTKLMVRLHCWQDDDVDNWDNMMSRVGLGQLMNNEDVALVEQWRCSSDKLVPQLFVLPSHFHTQSCSCILYLWKSLYFFFWRVSKSHF